MHFPPRARRFIFCALLLTWLAGRAELSAQQHPAVITAAQSTELPYRLSGRLDVTFGGKDFIGTATFIRRYTGLTAGHLLYDSDNGLATNVYYEPALYQVATSTIPVGYFAVLSGYQSAANGGQDSDPAFDQDMGYLLFSRPAPAAEWADFAADTDALVQEADFLLFGYAGEDGFSGDVQAFVDVKVPYYQVLGPALYENSSYYTEGGMSGGPLYVSDAVGMSVAAVNVAGTDLKDPALSDVRAITAPDQILFTEAEYAHGLVVSGTIKGAAAVSPGDVVKYKTGVVFKDGVQEGRDIPPRYGEIYLAPIGAHKKQVSVREIKTGRFKVEFSDGLASGDVITLALIRNTVARAAQTPLKTLTVTIQ